MHERTWFERNWKWLAAAAFLFVLLIIAGILFLVSRVMRSSDVYRQGVAAALHHPGVITALGDPVEAGFFTLGTVSVSGPSGSADLAIPLAGPKGEGVLYVVAEKEAGAWTMSRLEVEVEGRAERIELLNEAFP